MVSVVCIYCILFVNSIQTLTDSSYPEMSPNNPFVSTRQPYLRWMGGCDDGTWLDYEIGEAFHPLWNYLFQHGASPSHLPRKFPEKLPSKRGREEHYKPWRRSCLAKWTRPLLHLQDLKQNSQESTIEDSEFSFGSFKWESLSWNWRFPGQISYKLGFPGGAGGKEPTCQCRRCMRCRLDPWIGKIPWTKALEPTPVFFTEKSHGQRSLIGYGP